MRINEIKTLEDVERICYMNNLPYRREIKYIEDIHSDCLKNEINLCFDNLISSVFIDDFYKELGRLIKDNEKLEYPYRKMDIYFLDKYCFFSGERAETDKEYFYRLMGTIKEKVDSKADELMKEIAKKQCPDYYDVDDLVWPKK